MPQPPHTSTALHGTAGGQAAPAPQPPLRPCSGRTWCKACHKRALPDGILLKDNPKWPLQRHRHQLAGLRQQLGEHKGAGASLAHAADFYAQPLPLRPLLHRPGGVANGLEGQLASPVPLRRRALGHLKDCACRGGKRESVSRFELQQASRQAAI